MNSTKSSFVEQEYHFKGMWDVPSVCGLKIVRKAHKTIVIVTDLYEENPGTPVTEWNAKLASQICTEFEIKPEELVFIERTPDKQTKLSFNKETFFRVLFEQHGYEFNEPDWQELSKDEVNKLINE
ncbi:MAG: hypothetical protein V2I54_11080 [Bacteroidales bacterium]|jgi:hypothetical protein|nr:hypothetical protein [Bacteroidales bacterium]